MKAALKYSDLIRNNVTDYEKIGKVTAVSVFKHTRKNWKQWISLLDQAGARSWTHAEIVAFLKKKHRLSVWWQQGVALGFEIATGRRKEGQDINGKYMVTATKSLPCGVRDVWKVLLSPRGLEIWLSPLSKLDLLPKVEFETKDGFFGEVRTVSSFRRARLFWQSPDWEKHTVLEVLLVPKPGKRSILVFNHTGIGEARTKEALRVRWRKAADRISSLLPPKF